MELLFPSIGLVIALFLAPLFKAKISGWLSFLASIVIAVFSSFPAIQILAGASGFSNEFLTAFGTIALTVDPLSAWFIIIINIIFLAGSFYGQEYLSHYSKRTNDLKVHFALMPVFHASMIYVTMLNDLFFFVIVWEIMSLSSFILILFERAKQGNLKAATNYFIQMHISVLFLFAGSFCVYYFTGGSTFTALAEMPKITNAGNSMLVFILFFIGFGIKAGFIPFHTWLPHAHPAAPSHLSGIMSGVIIKMGIYGIIRVVMQSPADMITIGWIIMVFAAASGLYGVMLAIVQHNLKKLLAYHSIENIGIIGLGIGLGAIGIGYDNTFLAYMGFAGALLHTLNHSLFKSLLFFSAGNVYQSTGTVNIEQLGGLSKKMPYTTSFFLIGAIAICGLPPLNGFISEFIIFSGLFNAVHLLGISEAFSFVLIIAALALIGGLALLCFTKAFGIVFLGNARKPLPKEPVEVGVVKRIPMFILTAFILLIGFFPAQILQSMQAPLKYLLPNKDISIIMASFSGTLTSISMISAVFIGMILLILLVRRIAQHKVVIEDSETWGCGYVAPNTKMQYTASSYARTFRKLFHPLVFLNKDKINIEKVFPQQAYTYKSHSTDRIEDNFISRPVLKLIHFLGKFRIFQNGNTQSYLMYAFLFIIIVLFLGFIK